MARLRHMLMTFLTVMGLLVAIQPISARAACPMDAAMAMPAMHHHGSSPTPMSRDMQNCPVCLGVLPSLPIVEPHVLPPVAQVAGLPRTLLGIDPSLDPPPPRG